MAFAGGQNISVEIINKYEYGDKSGEDLSGLVDYLQYNLMMAQDIDNYKTEVPKIAEKAVKIAKDFVIRNGTVDSGDLHDSINWARIDKGFTLYAGVPYSGHIEYGFTGRDGAKKGPWPYLRPAMRIAAEMSTGILGDRAAQTILYGNGMMPTLKNGKTGVYLGRHSMEGSHHSASGQTARSFGSRGTFGSSSRYTRWTGVTSAAGYTRGATSMTKDHFRRGHL